MRKLFILTISLGAIVLVGCQGTKDVSGSNGGAPSGAAPITANGTSQAPGNKGKSSAGHAVFANSDGALQQKMGSGVK